MEPRPLHPRAAPIQAADQCIPRRVEKGPISRSDWPCLMRVGHRGCHRSDGANLWFWAFGLDRGCALRSTTLNAFVLQPPPAIGSLRLPASVKSTMRANSLQFDASVAPTDASKRMSRAFLAAVDRWIGRGKSWHQEYGWHTFLDERILVAADEQDFFRNRVRREDKIFCNHDLGNDLFE